MPYPERTPPTLPVVLLLGPQRAAMSGVSTHINLLFDSDLGQDVELRHFQVGSEGRSETRLARLGRLLLSPFALGLTLLAERVDIVHLNTSLNRRAYWRDLMYMLVARLLGVRVVYQVHGGKLPQQFAAGKRWLTGLLRASLRLPDQIVVLASCELAAYRAFLPQQSVRLLANAIDPLPYARPARRPDYPADGLQLLYIGRLDREKGLHEALHGLRLAGLQGARAHLRIAGGGPDEAALRLLVGELNLASAVSFVGPVFGEAKIRLLGEVDALLLPSYAEGLPYALLEGMAAGLPAITTPVGAIPDVVIEGEHGLLVPPRDIHAIARAIVRLAGNPAWLARMSGNCRERIAASYSIQHLAREFALLYAELLRPRQDRAVSRS